MKDNIIKRAISLILALVCALGVLPMSAFAAGLSSAPGSITQKSCDYMKIGGQSVRYAGGIMKRLREHEYNPDLMRLYVMGGGSCLIRHFVEYDPARVTINGDINATAKGYERLAEAVLRKSSVIV